jgi:hypothetical protein
VSFCSTFKVSTNIFQTSAVAIGAITASGPWGLKLVV